MTRKKTAEERHPWASPTVEQLECNIELRKADYSVPQLREYVITVRLSTVGHKTLINEAHAQQKSMNELCLDLLKDGVERAQVGREPPAYAYKSPEQLQAAGQV